jgi:hypothetical protein
VRTVVARAAAVVAAGLLVALVPATAAWADPVVSITSPGDGFLAGIVPISVSATGDSGDTPVSIHLQLDGTDVNGSDTACPVALDDPPTCTLTIPWDSSGSLGPHTLTAIFTEQLPDLTTTSAVSAAVAVTVERVPVVAIDSPALGSAVTGSVVVAVSASTDAGDSDPPASIAVTATPAGGSASPVGTQVCGSAATCSGTITWDSSAFDGGVTLTAKVTTANGLTRSIDLPVVAEAPTVAITAPTAGASVAGNVQVSVHATSTQAALDPLGSVGLYVDGALVDSLPCAAPASGTCDQVLSWDATGARAGRHTLSAKVATNLGLTVPSAGVDVSVASPPATVSISSPRARATVRGTVKVGVTAATSGSSIDLPRRIDLFVDGLPSIGRRCPVATSHSCVLAIPWATARLAGGHRLTARVTTTAGEQVFSARVRVWVFTGSVLRVSRVGVVPAGRTVTMHGRVVSTTTKHGVGGVSVRLTKVTGLGSVVVHRVTTASDGTFAYTFRASVTTRVIARASAPWLVASESALLQLVRAPVRCTLSATAVRSGRTGSGSCTVVSLPARTAVALYYTIRGRTTLLASGVTRGSTIPFTFRFTTRGFYTLKVVIGASPVYVKTTSATMGVTVR